MRGLPTTRISRFTRVVLTLDLTFSLAAGLVLYLLPTTADEHFAWSIKLPVTATFLGAGYLGAVATLIPTYRTSDWRRVRLVPVMGFALTFVTAVVTLRHLGEFHLGDGSAQARIAAWAWLVVYLVIPLLLAAAFATQERAGGRHEYAVDEPLRPLTRVVLGAQGVLATVLGIGLVLYADAFDALWPWPLPPLSSGAVGAWALTIAAGSWWGLREADWSRFALVLPGPGVFVALVVLGAVRYSEPLDARDWEERGFFTGLALIAAGFAASAWQQRRGSSAALR